MTEIRLTLPLPPRLTNSGKGRSRHWRALHKERKDYWESLDMLVTVGAIPRRGPTMQKAEATAVLYLWNPMDDGNAFARLKWVEDWLVRNGYIADDSRAHLRYTGIPEQHIDRSYQRVELVIREVLTP